MTTMIDSPAFARAWDLAKRSVLLVERFPRQRRAVLGRRLEEQSLTLHEALSRAARASSGGDRQAALQALTDADVALMAWGFALRLSADCGLVSVGEQGELARLQTELGRLIGGWAKKLRG
jgi:hypothetical protein